MNIRIERVGFTDYNMELYHPCKLFWDEAEVEVTNAEENDAERSGDPDLIVHLQLVTDEAPVNVVVT